MEFTTKINSKETDRLFGALIRQATNRRPLMVQIGGIMHDEIENIFDAEGIPRWPDLADSTKEARAKKKKWPGKILQVSGQLINSIQIQTSNDESIVGSNKTYAAKMHYGKKSESIPGRPFMKITQPTLIEIETAISIYLLKGSR